MSSMRMNQFFKTKMCPWFFKGRCERGSTCRFAHYAEELRNLPNLSRTSLCPAILKGGRCNNPERCRYAHDGAELRATNDLYKTSLCYLWMRGRCDAGDSCRHAHGTMELRTLPGSSSVPCYMGDMKDDYSRATIYSMKQKLSGGKCQSASNIYATHSLSNLCIGSSATDIPCNDFSQCNDLQQLAGLCTTSHLTLPPYQRYDTSTIDSTTSLSNWAETSNTAYNELEELHELLSQMNLGCLDSQQIPISASPLPYGDDLSLWCRDDNSSQTVNSAIADLPDPLFYGDNDILQSHIAQTQSEAFDFTNTGRDVFDSLIGTEKASNPIDITKLASGNFVCFDPQKTRAESSNSAPVLHTQRLIRAASAGVQFLKRPNSASTVFYGSKSEAARCSSIGDIDPIPLPSGLEVINVTTPATVATEEDMNVISDSNLSGKSDIKSPEVTSDILAGIPAESTSSDFNETLICALRQLKPNTTNCKSEVINSEYLNGLKFVNAVAALTLLSEQTPASTAIDNGNWLYPTYESQYNVAGSSSGFREHSMSGLDGIFQANRRGDYTCDVPADFVSIASKLAVAFRTSATNSQPSPMYTRQPI